MRFHLLHPHKHNHWNDDGVDYVKRTLEIQVSLGEVSFLRVHHISATSADSNQTDKPPKPAPEETIPFTADGETHQTWYKVFGDLSSSKSVPLVVIHGGKCGPGYHHLEILCF